MCFKKWILNLCSFLVFASTPFPTRKRKNAMWLGYPLQRAEILNVGKPTMKRWQPMHWQRMNQEISSNNEYIEDFIIKPITIHAQKTDTIHPLPSGESTPEFPVILIHSSNKAGSYSSFLIQLFPTVGEWENLCGTCRVSVLLRARFSSSFWPSWCWEWSRSII